jgi:hypothetical protein
MVSHSLIDIAPAVVTLRMSGGSSERADDVLLKQMVTAKKHGKT